ncbi:hypothetical protein BHE74_00028111 [Ensete ventricosum]|nr:hypothetical protein BHE74_00028111 [Ensete ventricosum]RZR93682.1 hypothetical protein BHM03_00022248 [Ensete ventricosum]
MFFVCALQVAWYWYFVLAFVDVQGNYLGTSLRAIWSKFHNTLRSIIERKDLESVKWSATMISLFLGFAASTFLFYTVVPFVLKVDWMYYLAFVLAAIGLIIYSVHDNKKTDGTTNEDEPDSLQYERLAEESSAAYNGVLAA